MTLDWEGRVGGGENVQEQMPHSTESRIIKDIAEVQGEEKRLRVYPRAVIDQGCEDLGMVINNLFNKEICIEV